MTDKLEVERTNEELAEQLSMYANHQGLDDDHPVRRSAQRLREMPDGERIEGWSDGHSWSKLQPQRLWFPATLILNPQEPEDGK